MMLAAHRQNGGARRQSLVEDIDLRTLITAELQGEQRQQDRFARAGRPDNELIADITDMGGQPERCGTRRLGIEQRRSGEMIVACRPCPDRGQRHQMRKVQGMDQRSEEHTSELQSLMRISYAVFCLKKKRQRTY